MTVQEEIRQRIERDALLARLRVKIYSGNATFADTSAYNNRAAEILGDVFSRRLPDISPAEREAICVELLQERYSDINSLLARVQHSLDEMIGLQLAPQHAPFNSERAHQIGRSTADPTVSEETQQRRARSAPATATRAMHDDYTRKNADFRSNAGLKCYINREAVPGCCAWCSAMAGRYEYGEEPDDVYRRHDNCGCTVTFENGRQRQDDWSKREWEAPGKDAGADEPFSLTEEQAAAAGAGERVVLTKEQAEALQAKNQLSYLTGGVKHGKMFTRAAYPNRRIRSDGNQVVDKATYQKLTRDFIRRGGIIRNDEEAARILEAQHVHAAYLPSLWAIAFSPEPTISEVLEETYHAEQDRKHMFGVELTDEVLLRREIDAQHHLLSLTERYKIPESEVELTKFNLANYERDLEKLLQSQGGGGSG